MGRSDGRPNTHIQEKKTPSGDSPAPAPPPAEERPAAAQEGRQPVWRWAATVWAIVFLFLTALALFDLLAGLFRR
jgi:hypothetical protein